MMYSPFRHIGSVLRKKKPIHLTFFVTRQCNSKCPFCFYLNKREARAGVIPDLSLAEIERISGSLGNLLWLAFSGGEIFLRKDLVDISRTFYRNNRPAIMLYPTNGLLPELIHEMTVRILEECGKSVIAVKLSVDGLNEAHDRLRGTPGAFDLTMRTYELLGELPHKYPNFELGVNTVFCAENQDKTDEIIEFVRGLKNIKTHTISLIRGDVPDEKLKRVDERKYLHAIERLERNLKEKASPVYRFRGGRIKAAQDVLQRRLIHRTIEARKRLMPCYAGRLNLVLTETGDVYPCEILSQSFGNVRDHGYDMKRVVKSSPGRNIIASINNDACHCTHECYFMTNILFNPRMYPALMKEYLQIV